MLTSIPSLFSAYSSKLRMAVLMVRGGGKTVRPMLMALLRFESRTMISCRLPSTAAFYEKHKTPSEIRNISDHVSWKVDAVLHGLNTLTHYTKHMSAITPDLWANVHKMEITTSNKEPVKSLESLISARIHLTNREKGSSTLNLYFTVCILTHVRHRMILLSVC